MYLCAINLYIIVGVYVCGREEESGRERTERERKRERKREREGVCHFLLKDMLRCT